MANVLVGNLPTYTGDTTGVYVVMNDSGNTTTYKVLNSYLGVPAWTSAGAIQSVGWSGTTTAPTIGTTVWNNISYRQLGVKQWEIIMSFNATGEGGSGGSGDYLFKLPNSLSFDTTLSSQQIYTDSINTTDSFFSRYALPSGSGIATTGGGIATTSSGFAPVVYNTTQFRVMAFLPGTELKCMGPTYYATTNTTAFQLTFQFTSL